LNNIKKCVDKPLQPTTQFDLDGLHMTQTTHDFVEWENPTKNSPKWSCSERQWWFKLFLPKMP
jgi:hypothetical protein